ncbi:hypothetical protein EJ03DRAFT_339719 [Teratosphaeria nubilosa]|uniref:Uncharacterized protein n=1 Tax=Teratosphaeria nubilosa TaxID=161662 RepID=A0A6G1KW97_9PEZI|nr:hypothetical protein EJ03DRAFT_339719 [Teratosphaeria nubilosa]
MHLAVCVVGTRDLTATPTPLLAEQPKSRASLSTRPPPMIIASLRARWAAIIRRTCLRPVPVVLGSYCALSVTRTKVCQDHGIPTMGTLTAGQPRLDAYCAHKLPTSCRLTSIPECCACADERAHSAAYTVYVDGVGLVPRGTRWQRYCWFCKEFWENRVTASGLRPGQTRIPEVPDQTDFLKRWYEFHQGYRAITQDDGTEERVAVLGEDFRDVSPGYLPRTLEELRAGRAANDMAGHSRQQQTNVQQQTPSGPGLEETLDSLFEDASLEDQPLRERTATARPAIARTETSPAASEILHQMREANRRHRVNENRAFHNSIHAQAMTAAGSRSREYQARRIAALRRELHRMRNGIERVIVGLRDLGESVPDHSEATGRLTDLGRTLDNIQGVPSQDQAQEAINSVNHLTVSTAATDNTTTYMQARVDEARNNLNEARRNRDQARSELDAAEQEYRTSQQRLHQVQREQRTAENYMRLFGTREEMQAAGDQYESPIGGMFNRAYERFRAAEEVRREERTLRRVLEDEARGGGEEAARRLAELETQERDIWSVPRASPSQQQQASSADSYVAAEPRSHLEEYYELIRTQGRGQAAPAEALARTGAGTRHDELVAEFRASLQRRLANRTDGGTEAAPAENMSEQQTVPSELEAIDVVPAADSENERHADYAHILLHLLRHPGLAEDNIFTTLHLYGLLSRLNTNRLSENDERELNDLRERPRVVWGSCLITARFLRRRRAGQQVHMVPDVPQDDFQRTADNIEVMAEAYQRSGTLRGRALGLSPPERLQVLYRLQAGERSIEDIRVLSDMLRNQDTFELATYYHLAGDTRQDNTRLAELAEARRAAAREGDHSRSELNAQRRATHALALAAGRAAMRTGPAALLEQMASQDAETRAAYERLRENGFDPAGDTPEERLLRSVPYRPFGATRETSTDPEDDEDEDEEEAGLDAKDSGRPEPRQDEELTVSMECKICYTQLAEIACLPRVKSMHKKAEFALSSRLRSPRQAEEAGKHGCAVAVFPHGPRLLSKCSASSTTRISLKPGNGEDYAKMHVPRYMTGETAEEAFAGTIISSTTHLDQLASREYEAGFADFNRWLDAGAADPAPEYGHAVSQSAVFANFPFCVTAHGLMCMVPKGLRKR